MSAATATADAGAPPAKSRKKLIVLVVAAVLVLVVAGVGAMLMLKTSAHDEDAADDGAAASAHATAPVRDPKHPPAYVPLDPFTVNLADKQADRYAQIAITLELRDPSVADGIKAFMPAVRNNILMALAHKTAGELLERDGKSRLAEDIRRETARALGVEVLDQEEEEDAEDQGKKKKKKKSRKAPPMPVTAVHFATFIIQ